MEKNRKSSKIVIYAALIFLAAIWVFPILWIFLTSFRAEGGQFVSYIIPKQFQKQINQ
ncbi:hypothetical protein [Enterococcus pallens]|uniref:ABC transmembrane type-1 domain-containing protein n=1 Tax=Enterococcus pallens ATCC BAA-351 TaxID=1158607 RepID=R2T7V9_9ENTE|nr:hypothetical protein [Enterococcus pallens]EOH96334.1 hypothetical protein UAU_00984 [Enterococcus pallens ATCC BAA-351]EOU14453.1 hypothetical protein I588_04810 [Enterococcus pallens ATCC BAA-351]